MPDIFLSYSRDDQATARRFAEGFEREGLSVWWDQALNPGEAFDKVTEKALEEAKAVVVLWSKKSVDSRWVRAEATQANNNGNLVPAMIEPCKRPILFELTHTVDLSHWHGDQDDKVWLAYVAGVRRYVGKGGAHIPTAPHAAERSGRRRGLDAMVLSIAAAVLVVAGGILWAVLRHGSEQPAPQVTTPPAPAAATTDSTAASAASRTSVAVMAFSNLTGDPSKDYLGDGMAEELINVLTKVPGLTVPSRTSSFAYKGRNTDMKRIARDLNVSTILEGSVRSAGETIRITAQLIDAQTDRHIWSQTYNRKFTDLFKLQDDLAHEIVTAFKTTMNANLPEFVSQAPPTKDLEAYHLYLQGGASMRRQSEASIRSALRLFDQAIARDPGFARAYLARGGARAQSGAPFAEVERDVRRSMQIDPELVSEAQALLANTEVSRGDWTALEERFKAANGRGSTAATFVWWPTGQLRKAKATYEESYRRAPDSGISALNIGTVSSAMGLDADALKYANAAVALGVDGNGRRVRQVYADIAARAGRYDEAIAHMRIALADSVRALGSEEVIRLVYEAMEDPSKSAAAISALGELLPKLKAEDWVVMVWAMGWSAKLGHLDMTYELGDQLWRQFATRGSPPGAWAWLWSPELRPFRQDARFQGFATRLGLMAYWQKYNPPDSCDLNNGKLTCH